MRCNNAKKCLETFLEKLQTVDLIPQEEVPYQPDFQIKQTSR